jgi:hypothetical protein
MSGRNDSAFGDRLSIRDNVQKGEKECMKQLLMKRSRPRFIDLSQRQREVRECKDKISLNRFSYQDKFIDESLFSVGK